MLDFSASWCGPCHALKPVFRALALAVPTARFLTLDVDECDDDALDPGPEARGPGGSVRLWVRPAIHIPSWDIDFS